MFTGLIETTATLESLEADSDRTILSLSTDLIDELAIGDSIAINGVCLTAAAFDSSRVQFHLLNETLHCTNLGALKVGDRVNVERSMPHRQHVLRPEYRRRRRRSHRRD